MIDFSSSAILAKAELSMKNIPKIFTMALIPVVPLCVLSVCIALFHFNMVYILSLLYVDYSTPILIAKVALALLGVLLSLFTLSIQYKLVPIVRGSHETVSYLDVFHIFKHPKFASIFVIHLIRILLLGLVSLTFFAAVCLLLLSPLVIFFSLLLETANPTDVGSILFVTSLCLASFALLLFIPFNYNYYFIEMVLYDQLEAGTYTNLLAVFQESARLMKGYKKQAVYLDLTFLAWNLLRGSTFGIAGIYTIPYTKLSRIHFYQAVLDDRQNKQENETKI